MSGVSLSAVGMVGCVASAVTPSNLSSLIVVQAAGLYHSDGVEQLTRYLELLNRDPLLAPVHGVLAAQQIKPQARTLAEDRGIRCVTLDYDTLRGIESDEFRLF